MNLINNLKGTNSGFIININDKNANHSLNEYLKNYRNEKILVMCIGTDKCIGDCLAPLVGTLLQKNNFNYPIIGTLDNPVHALNIENVILNTLKDYKGYFIIAIDACIGDEEAIGDIQVRPSPIYPGKGVGKLLPQIGDISIVGVVDSFGNSELFSVRSIRLSFIMHMAETIVNALLSAFK